MTPTTYFPSAPSIARLTVATNQPAIALIAMQVQGFRHAVAASYLSVIPKSGDAPQPKAAVSKAKTPAKKKAAPAVKAAASNTLTYETKGSLKPAKVTLSAMPESRSLDD